MGIDKVYLTGYSPYPVKEDDPRLPHIRAKIDRQIHKTALGAEQSINWDYQDDLMSLISEFKADGFIVLALEQTPRSVELQTYAPDSDTVLIVGNEVEGVDSQVLKACDQVLAIPMAGQKESFNVAAAAAMALYHLKFP